MCDQRGLEADEEGWCLLVGARLSYRVVDPSLFARLMSVQAPGANQMNKMYEPPTPMQATAPVAPAAVGQWQPTAWLLGVLARAVTFKEQQAKSSRVKSTSQEGHHRQKTAHGGGATSEQDGWRAFARPTKLAGGPMGIGMPMPNSERRLHRCADEGQHCICEGGNVYYGRKLMEGEAPGSGRKALNVLEMLSVGDVMVITGSTRCSNEVFADVAFGFTKQCLCAPRPRAAEALPQHMAAGKAAGKPASKQADGAVSAVGTDSAVPPPKLLASGHAGISEFGPRLHCVTLSRPLTFGGEGCEPPTTRYMRGSAALLLRGSCSFARKAKLAQEAGASAVLLYDPKAANEMPLMMADDGGVGKGVHIPTIGLPRSSGEELRQALAAARGKSASKALARAGAQSLSESLSEFGEAPVVMVQLEGAELGMVTMGEPAGSDGAPQSWYSHPIEGLRRCQGGEEEDPDATADCIPMSRTFPLNANALSADEWSTLRELCDPVDHFYSDVSGNDR